MLIRTDATLKRDTLTVARVDLEPEIIVQVSQLCASRGVARREVRVYLLDALVRNPQPHGR